MAGNFHKVLTFHGTLLFANRADGYIVNAMPGRSDLVSVYLFMPRGSVSVAYLLADLPAGTPLRLHPQTLTGSIVPVGITRARLDGSFGLYSLLTRFFVVAAEPAPGAASGHVIVVSPDAFAYEMMTPLACAAIEVPERLAVKAHLIEQMGGADHDINRLVSFIMALPQDNGDLREVINAIGFTYGSKQYQALAELLFSSPAVSDRLVSLFSDDLAARWGLTATIGWKRKQLPPPAVTPASKSGFWRRLRLRHSRSTLVSEGMRPPARQESEPARGVLDVGTEFDGLQSEGARGEYVSLPQAANVFMRRTVSPRRRACVLATARNEALYIVEWVAHYKAIGFDHLFIYSNDNLDGSDDILAALAAAGEITWIRNRIKSGGAPQLKAYNHALQILPEILDYEWTLVADLDEYLNFNEEIFRSVGEYLSWSSVADVDCIAFNWAVPGSNGESHWRDAPLRRRFPTRNRPQDVGFHYSPLVKSMFRTAKFPVSMPHHPLTFKDERFEFKAASMRPYVFIESEGQGQSAKIDTHNAWVTHYFYKSNEEFLVKFSRSRGDAALVSSVNFDALASGFIKSFMAQARPGYPDDPRTAFDDRHDLEMERLLAHPGVKAAHLSSRLFYANRLVTLLPLAANASGVAEAGEDGQAFLRPLLEAQLRLTPSHTE
jgi:hypothetical protein